MTIKKPLRPLKEPEYKTLRKGKILHRIHHEKYGFDQFNPGEGGPTRFTPFYDSSGKPVPSLYASSTLRATIHETIFHDFLPSNEEQTIPIRSIHKRIHSKFQTKRALRLVELRNPFVKKWGISQVDLIGSRPTLYDETARWAQAIYEDFPEAEGLIWTSAQRDPDDAILFFGGRVKAADFEWKSSRHGKDNKSFLRAIRNEGEKRGIEIIT